MVSIVIVSLSLDVSLRFVPLPAALFLPVPESVRLLDRNGELLRMEPSANSQFSRRVDENKIPATLRDATLAAEDKRFYRHGGVDYLATSRAAVGFIRHGRIISGGSTISQQLIKLAQPRPRTIRTKLIEAVQSMRLEQLWPKDRILAEYLNRLDYGNRQRGCANASQFYFGRSVYELSRAQAALLAGLPQAPSRLNPHRHRKRALSRQRWVLARMHAIGRMGSGQLQFALDEPLRFQPPHREFHAPHFVAMATRDGIPSNELNVRTTMDLQVHREILRIFSTRLSELAEQNVQNAAAVVIHNPTGEVRALVGSANYFHPNGGQINGAWTARSPGSALKPMLYQLAFENGFTAASILADIPCEFPTSTGLYRPVNYDRRFHGPVSARFALANSLNVPAVRLLNELETQTFRNRLEALGIGTMNRRTDHYGLGMALGNPEVRLLELVNAYATLARLGTHRPVRFLPGGKPASEHRLLDTATCWLVADILQDNTARSHSFGLDSPLRFEFPVACKTGTSSDFRDNWAFGFTPEFTVGVWVGNHDGTALHNVSGIMGAGPVMHDLLTVLNRRFGTSWYPRPADVLSHKIDPLTGKRSMRNGIEEWFIDGTVPERETPGDRTEDGRAKLPAIYKEWFRSADNHLSKVAVVQAEKEAPRILSPIAGSVFFLDPDLPESSHVIPLRSNPTSLVWHSKSLRCVRRNGETIALMEPGRHEFTAVHIDGGQILRTWIEIRGL